MGTWLAWSLSHDIQNQMKIKTKTDLEFTIPEVVLNIEVGCIVVPVFPQFKKPSNTKPSQLLKPKTVTHLSSPSKNEDTLSSSTKITSQNPVSYPKYVVNHSLQIMRKNLNTPQRSEVEGQIIKNLISQNGRFIYMLQIDWASSYTAYLQHKTATPPGPITNQSLFSEVTYRPNLKQDQDFVLMNQSTWSFIQTIYGGGPEVLYTDYMRQTQPDLLPFDNTTKPTLSRVSSIQSGLVDTQSYMSLTLPFQKSQYQLPPIGLYNEHNYCFMHAALQGLMSVEQINCWMLNEGPQLCAKHKIRWVAAYVEIILAANAKKAGAQIKVATLKQLIRDKFDPRLQHDSHEFLRFFLENIAQDIVGQDKYEQPITDIIFQGQMMSLVECQSCLYKSSKLEAFMDLSLSMTATLMNSLKQFFAQEYLHDHYQCENCGQTTTAVKRYVIGTPPQYLIIHFKRFSMYPQKLKLQGHIDFPLFLDVDEFCSIKVKYKLRSVLVHYGTAERGHYVNFSLRQNQWYFFDDHKVYMVSETDVLQQAAYLLFYEKIEEYLLDMQ